MRISRVSIFRVELPYLHGTYQWSRGAVSVADSTIVRVDTDDGLGGWGESCPIPGYLPTHAESVRAGLGVRVPHLLGMDPRRIGFINDILDRQLIGHPHVNYNTVHTAACAPVARDGVLHVADAPGLGIEPDLKVLGKALAVHE